MQQMADVPPAKFGLIGFILGVVSIVVILIQLSAFFEPQEEKSAGTIIGEIAADIKLSAARAISGEPAPVTAPPPPDYTQFIVAVALCAAGVAVVLGGIGLYRNEPHRLSYLAIGFGASAFVMQFVFWLAIIICAIALLVSIIENLDSIVS